MAAPQQRCMHISTHAQAAALLGALRAVQATAATTRIEAVWARHQDEVRAAQQLRWRVFAGEMGATLKPLPGMPTGVDADLFDAHCEHLIVRTLPCDDGPTQVVGTYRVSTPSAARRLGALYSDGEFDLVRLRHLRPHLADLGRSCTDPQVRSVNFCSARACRVSSAAPACRCVMAAARPPRCGAQVLGPPAWDPDFGSADLPMMMRLVDLPPACRKRFITS